MCWTWKLLKTLGKHTKKYAYVCQQYIMWSEVHDKNILTIYCGQTNQPVSLFYWSKFRGCLLHNVFSLFLLLMAGSSVSVRWVARRTVGGGKKGGAALMGLLWCPVSLEREAGRRGIRAKREESQQGLWNDTLWNEHLVGLEGLRLLVGL